MRHYEVTFIVDPTLSGEEVNTTAQKHIEALKGFGCEITAVDEMGLRQLAYPINRRSSGIYYCVEFAHEVPDFLNKFELGLKRDEKLLRYLTVSLDKYGVKYNDDKRNGRIGKKREQAMAAQNAEGEEVVDLDKV